MSWYGNMSGLGHEPPTFEEWNSSQNPPYEEGTADYQFYQNYFNNNYNSRTKAFHYETSPHPWVAHHKSLPGFHDWLVETGQLEAYKALSTWSREEVRVILKEVEGKTDHQIDEWFRTGSFGSPEPSGSSDILGALFFLVVVPTLIFRLPASVPLSPKWFKKHGLA